MSEKKKKVTIRISESAYEILKTMAEESNGTVAREVRLAIISYIMMHTNRKEILHEDI